jgi:hypothetical protein
MHFRIRVWSIHLRGFRYPVPGGRGISVSDAPPEAFSGIQVLDYVLMKIIST